LLVNLFESYDDARTYERQNQISYEGTDIEILILT